MKFSPVALAAALMVSTTAVIAQPGKLPDNNDQRGGQQIPRDVMPPDRARDPSAPKGEAQKESDALQQSGQQMRPKPASELPTATPTRQTEAERKAALEKERGEQMRPSVEPMN